MSHLSLIYAILEFTRQDELLESKETFASLQAARSASILDRGAEQVSVTVKEKAYVS